MRVSFDLENRSVRFLALLLLADLLFLVLHLLHAYGGLSGELGSPLYLLGRDRGYAEFFQYTKEFWIVVLLILLARHRARFLYLSWSLLFFYLLLDDSLEIHEVWGERLAAWRGLQPGLGLRPQDFGELGVSLFFGLLLLGSITLAHYLSRPPDRRLSRRLFMLVAVLAFFGVALDMLDIVIYGARTTSFLDIVENWGEMVVMSVMAWAVFASPHWNE